MDCLANQKENPRNKEVNRDTKNQDQQELQEGEENEKIQQEEKEVSQDKYGPWMLVQRKQRGPRINPKNQRSRNQEDKKSNRQKESNNRNKDNNSAGSSGEGKSRTRYDKSQAPMLNAKRDEQDKTQEKNQRKESNQSNVSDSIMEVEKMLGKQDKILMDVGDDIIQQDVLDMEAEPAGQEETIRNNEMMAIEAQTNKNLP
ncbi:probable elastin-binding protein EbpS [Hibiscus syriacus]|uniref:probable elastin-binding protein EbpS n=1 Tax=Hibiscus syriacus TaxID=106335 RepID=UPI0019219277|nr:probable elastin-binding protein EbpS [Hibiscus syriacus]